MKKLQLLLSLAAILLSFQGALAYEQRQDALYIFCNDGQFHAFFFGDIDRIAYSKIDTLGIEQPDYVVQEVWALDTVFRIPLTAIDSVAFVTPDTRYKPDVFRPDSSIVDYIVASDSVKWIRLATNTPQAMIPKTGDKFLIEKETELIPDGFVGRVTSVEQGSDGYTVMTGDIDPLEIYDQLVVKVAAASPAPDGPRHAPPHNIDGTVDLSYVMEKPIDVISANGRVDLKMSQEIIPDFVSVEGEGGLNYDLNESLKYRGFLFIDPLGKMCYTHTAKLFHYSDLALDFKGSMKFNGEIPLWKTKDPIDLDFFKMEASAGFFIKLEYAAFTAGFRTVREDTYVDYHALTSKGPLSPLTPPSLALFDHIGKMSHVNELDSTTFFINNDGTYTIGTGFFGKFDFKYKLPFFKNDSSTVKAGIEGGVNISFRAPEISPLVEEGQFNDLMSTPEIYSKLNLETDISYKSYAKLSAALSLFGFDLSADKDKWEWNLQEMGPFGLVPRIDDISYGPDDEDEVERPYRFKFTSPIGRNLLYSVPIGFMVFDDANGLIEDWCGLSYSHEELMSSYSNVFTTLDPVKGAKKTYRVYPRISYLDHAMLTDKWVDVEVDSACIDIERPLLVVDEEVGSTEVSVIPNMAKVECSSTADWLTFTWLDHRNELFVSWAAMPEGMHDRKAKIILQGKNSTTGQPIIEDSVVVWQMVPFINVTPEELNFTAEGGTQTATITGTNLTDFEVFTDYGFIHPSIEGNVITVTVDPNNETDARGGQLHIRGKKPDGETSSTYIYVSQEGTGEDPYDPNLPNGGKRMFHRVNVSGAVKFRYSETSDYMFFGDFSCNFGINQPADLIDPVNYEYTEKTTENGNDLHVELTQINVDETYYFIRDTMTVSFDILDYKNPVAGNYQIVNLKYMKYGERSLDGVHWKKDKWDYDVEMTNIPITTVEDLEHDDVCRIEADATVADGVEVINARWGEYTIFFPDEPSNGIDLRITFLGDFWEYYVWDDKGGWVPQH